MKKMRVFYGILVFVLAIAGIGLTLKSWGPYFPEASELPESFDLRQKGFLPPIEEQAWGTCWAFATTLAMESNLMVTGRWKEIESGHAALSPYYLDKYSGFTRKGNSKHVKEGWYSGQGERYPGSNRDNFDSGLIVHLGGDYKTATAFLSNNLGAPQERLTPKIPREGDHQLFGDLPTEGVLRDNNYTYFFPKKVLWLTREGTLAEKRVRIKKAIMKYGAVASAEAMEENPLAVVNGLYLFGMLDKSRKMDHAINLIGWDDNIKWEGHRGAWLAQDSDHRNKEGGPLGHYYVLYDDMIVGKDPEMGGVSFQDVMVSPFKKVYTHSLHGNRFTIKAKSVANKFVAKDDHEIQGVGFYTSGYDVSYSVKFKKSLEGEALKKFEGTEILPGFHFLDLRKENIPWKKESPLFVEIQLSNESHAYDATSVIKVLLGSELPIWGEPIEVKSIANKNESFILNEKSSWKDFTELIPTGNFAINLYIK